MALAVETQVAILGHGLVPRPENRHGFTGVGGTSSGVVVNARWDNLVAGWKMDEESDGSAPVTRVDVLETYNLSDNNTVASGTGLIENAASFVSANSETLSVAGLPDFSGTWTYATWVKANGTVGFRGVVTTTGGTPFRAYFNNGGFVLVTEFNSFTPAGFSATLDSGWHLLVIWHDDSDDTIGCSFDGAAAATYNPRDLVSSTTLVIGNALGGNYFNGEIDETYLFSVVKNNAWIAGMYNAGVGRSHPN